MSSVHGISETIVDISCRAEDSISENQLLLSQTLQTFCAEATSLSGLIGMTAGRTLACLVKAQTFKFLPQIFGNSASKAAFYHYASIGAGCLVEGIAFPTATELARTGEFKLGSSQEIFHGFLTIALCKGLTKGMPVESILMRHGAQDIAMSALDAGCEEIGILEKQQISFCQRVFMAEIISLRMEASAQFLGAVCPELSMLEAKQELKNQFSKIRTGTIPQNPAKLKGIWDELQTSFSPRLLPAEGRMEMGVESRTEESVLKQPNILAMSRLDLGNGRRREVMRSGTPVASSRPPSDWPSNLSTDWWNLIPRHGSRLYTGRKVETTADHLAIAVEDVALKMFGGEKNVDLVIGFGSFFDQPGFGKAARELNPDKIVDLYVMGDIKKMMASYAALEKFDSQLADWCVTHSSKTDGVFIKVDIPTEKGLLRFKVTAIGRDHFMAETADGPKIGFPQMRFKDVVEKNVLWECSKDARESDLSRVGTGSLLDRVRKIRQRLVEIAYLKMGSGIISSLLPDWKHFFLNRFSRFFKSGFHWSKLLPFSRLANFRRFHFTGAELALGFFDTFDFEFIRIHENLPFFKSAYKGLVQFEERAESSRKIMTEALRDFANAHRDALTVDGKPVTPETLENQITEKNVYEVVFGTQGFSGGAIGRSVRYWSRWFSLFSGQLRTTYHYLLHKWPVDKKCSRGSFPVSQGKYVRRKFERAGLLPASTEISYPQLENLAYKIYKSGEFSADEYDLFRRWLAKKPQMLLTQNKELLKILGALSVEDSPLAQSVVVKMFNAISEIQKLDPEVVGFIRNYQV